MFNDTSGSKPFSLELPILYFHTSIDTSITSADPISGFICSYFCTRLCFSSFHLILCPFFHYTHDFIPFAILFFFFFHSFPTHLFSSSPDVGAGPDRSCCSLQFVSVKHQLMSKGACAQLLGHSCGSAATQVLLQLLMRETEREREHL